jgi:hypothetical protein
MGAHTGFGRNLRKEERNKWGFLEAIAEGGNRLCRKFLASIFRHKPKFVPMIKKKEKVVARSPIINIGPMEDKTTTFKFPYSHSRVHLEPEFIPKDKKKAELIIGMYFCQLHLLYSA